MKIEIWWIGKTFQDFTQKGYAEFLKRIQKFNATEIIEIADIKGQNNPKILKNKELLASDALQVIEDYKIQLLIVTDENSKLVGVLHIHDLIEAGIK